MVKQESCQEKIQVYSYEDAINKSDLDQCAKLIMYVLYSHANQNTKDAFPSASTIADEADVHRTTVFKKLKILEQLGFIKRHNRRTKKGLTSNLYDILLPSKFQLTFRSKSLRFNVEDSQDQGEIDTHDSVAKLLPLYPTNTTLVAEEYNPSSRGIQELYNLTLKNNSKDSNLDSNMIDSAKNDVLLPSDRETRDQEISQEKERSKTKTNSKKQEILEQDFLDFYTAYPRKIGKTPAQKAYLKARKSKSHEEIMLTLKINKENWSHDKTQTQFIPHPATWLNREPWNDSITEQVIAQEPSRSSELELKKWEHAERDKINEDHQFVNKISVEYKSKGFHRSDLQSIISQWFKHRRDTGLDISFKQFVDNKFKKGE